MCIRDRGGPAAQAGDGTPQGPARQPERPDERQGTARRPVPVSYTHLDVYKRQVFARLAVGIDPETGREIKPETPGTIDEKLHADVPAGTEVMVCLEVARPESVDLPTLKRCV